MYAGILDGRASEGWMADMYSAVITTLKIPRVKVHHSIAVSQDC